MKHKHKVIRITTVPLSLDKLLDGQLRFMNSFYDVIAVSAEKDYLEKVGAKEGVKTFNVELTRKITPLRDLLALVKLFIFLRRQKPLIVHTHTPKAGLIGMLAALLAGVPNRLHTVAGMPLLEATGFKRRVLDFVERLTYSCATKIYPNSNGLAEIILKNNYCNRNKLKVLANGSSNGINTTHFDPALFSESDKADLKNQLEIPAAHFVFVFVGRIVKDKGINELIQAFSRLSEESDKVTLLLVGDYEHDLDPLEHETLKRIQKNNAIVSVGFQKDVRPYLAISDALAFPSYREGFPNVVMQAGAMGLCSIVSNINGCNEIIVNSENGLIIPVKNATALYEAMKKMAVERHFSDVMKSRSREMIISRYDQTKVWHALLAEYQNLSNG